MPIMRLYGVPRQLRAYTKRRQDAQKARRRRDSIALSRRGAGRTAHSHAHHSFVPAMRSLRSNMELFYRDFRRLLVNDKTFPAAFHDYFIRDMEFSGSEDYYLALDAPDGKKSGYAFFPGCQLGGSNPDYVLKAYRFLLDKLPGTALMLACCGIPAEWAGEQQMLDAHTAKLRADWERLGKPAMILACPTCQKAFTVSAGY